ncbi:exosortase 2 [Burkholderiales bacterium JOSHI_001]|nr:exosortase 2 [Burkholderiales bacterium JOSHI_001]
MKLDAETSPLARWLPAGVDLGPGLLLLLGWALLYGPTYHELSRTIWARDEQGHGPIILGLAVWLFWRLRDALVALPEQPARGPGMALFVVAMLLYVVGRSQAVAMFEAGSQIPLLMAILLLMKGPRALRLAWFPLFFMLFMVPLPATFVAAVTTPLKSAVSAVASTLLFHAGYPVGRTGVVMTVGPYQLLVADACAGLNSMFTLEALGMLYMQLKSHTSAARNIFLAIVIVPISFVANVIRVIILVLVTYHFGDAAGQGFVHGFAGMVLFMVALTLILSVDGLVSLVLDGRKGRRP